MAAFFRRRIFAKRGGQAVVEYVLILAVAVLLVLSAFRIIRQKVLPDEGDCRSAPEGLMCRIRDIITATPASGSSCGYPFRCYHVR